MEPSDNSSGRIDDPAGGQARRPSRSVAQEAELPTANHTNPVQVMPCQIQSLVKVDDQGRRYMVLENLPLDENYVANWINNGGEFAIGGTTEFISDALASELTARGDQDSMNQRKQAWHVVAIPDSNMTNGTISNLYSGSEATQQYPIATHLRPSQQSRQNDQQASGLQQTSQHSQTTIVPQKRRLYDEQATFVQQTPFNGQQAGIPPQSFHGANQQPVLAHNSAMGGYGQEYSSAPQLQQSQFTTPMSGGFGNGAGSAMTFAQEQLYSPPPQHGNLQGFGPNSGPAQGNYQGQNNNMMLSQGSGFPIDPLPQVHQPVFDKYGYIVGEQDNRNARATMYGGSLYDEDMYRSRSYNDFGHSQPHVFQERQQRYNQLQERYNQLQQQYDQLQQVQGTDMRQESQLEGDAQSFYSFVKNEMDEDVNDQDEHDQEEGGQEGVDQDEVYQEEIDQEEADQEEVDQEEDDRVEDDQDQGDQAEGDSEEEEIQDEGIAMGNTSGKDANTPNSPHELLDQRPEFPPAEILWASERSPYRFQDRTGMGVCDYCDRIGHEAEDCLKWDPDHYDKAVCTACNNKEHSLDECPRFRAMSRAEKQALLVEKGAGRPGVRSQYHAWTRYVARDAAGLPLTRRFLHDLSNNPGSGAISPEDVWKEWDYDQGGVPELFRDSVAEALAGDYPVLVDERFMDGKHGFGRKVHPGAQLFN